MVVIFFLKPFYLDVHARVRWSFRLFASDRVVNGAHHEDWTHEAASRRDEGACDRPDLPTPFISRPG
ncbi:hypothetical protein CGLAMM_02085 [Acetobacteraceae bacterium EV16G]|uniref:Uncharacterized protein n=1 Tax=Sorlinia euscelidii TaxID=3081148 RepID=A0ABU7U1Q5_9PROT